MNDRPQMPQRTIRVRRPTAAFPVEGAASEAKVNRPLRGLRVGLRQDTWRSYHALCKWWSEWLARDGAIPVPLLVGERTGELGEKTRNDLKAWAGSIDCAVSGLGT